MMADHTKRSKCLGFLRKTLSLLLNPRYVFCYGIAWCITNGWAYALAVIGTWLKSKWLIALGSGYLAVIWTPFTPEKILTTAVAIWLLRRLFPNDQKTLAVFIRIQRSAKERWKRFRYKKRIQQTGEET